MRISNFFLLQEEGEEEGEGEGNPAGTK